MVLPFGSLRSVGTTLLEIGEPWNEIVSGGCVPPLTCRLPLVIPCERMLIVPVPGGTVNVIVLPTICCPLASVCRADDWTPRWQVPGSLEGPDTPPGTAAGAVPFGVHDGDAVSDRHAPLMQAANIGFTLAQSLIELHEGKQSDPVDVLTHLLPAGQVLWSAGLHAAVHAGLGNSGVAFAEPAQVSPAPVHGTAVLHAFPRVALAGRPCAGQLAAGRQAPNPAQQV